MAVRNNEKYLEIMNVGLHFETFQFSLYIHSLALQNKILDVFMLMSYFMFNFLLNN